MNKKNYKPGKKSPASREGRSPREDRFAKNDRNSRDVKGQEERGHREARSHEERTPRDVRSHEEIRPHEQEAVEGLIYGRNAVLEALKAGSKIDKLVLMDQEVREGSVQKIIGLAKDAQIPIKHVDKMKMDLMTGHGRHQGVAIFLAPVDYVELPQILERAKERGEAPFVIVLDQLEDPHNLGAIIRTANVVGAHGVIIPKNRAVSLTATVAKTSAGAILYTPVCRVTNLARTLEELKEAGLWITGADMEGTPMYDVDLRGPIALVIGSEGKGLGRLVKDKCDFIATIPMKGDVNSLNASVAAGVLMYEAMRQRS